MRNRKDRNPDRDPFNGMSRVLFQSSSQRKIPAHLYAKTMYHAFLMCVPHHHEALECHSVVKGKTICCPDYRVGFCIDLDTNPQKAWTHRFVVREIDLCGRVWQFIVGPTEQVREDILVFSILRSMVFTDQMSEWASIVLLGIHRPVAVGVHIIILSIVQGVIVVIQNVDHSISEHLPPDSIADLRG